MTEKEHGYEITEQDKEKIRRVEIMVQLKMIERDVSKKDAYKWCSYDLTHNRHDNKPNRKLTDEERESLKICESRLRSEVEAEQERTRSGQEDEKVIRQKEPSYIVFRKDLDCAIWVIENTTEFERLTNLHEIAVACGKLIGFNSKTGDWNQEPFPATPTDAQKKVIRSDIDAYMKALTNFDEYSQYLARKYNLDVGELKHYKEWILYHQSTVPIKSYFFPKVEELNLLDMILLEKIVRTIYRIVKEKPKERMLLLNACIQDPNIEYKGDCEALFKWLEALEYDLGEVVYQKIVDQQLWEEYEEKQDDG